MSSEHDPALVEKAAEALQVLDPSIGHATDLTADQIARAVLDAVVPEIQGAMVELVARRFQLGGWTILTAPPPAGAIPSLALGQRVTDWLRAQQAGRDHG